MVWIHSIRVIIFEYLKLNTSSISFFLLYKNDLPNFVVGAPALFTEAAHFHLRWSYFLTSNRVVSAPCKENSNDIQTLVRAAQLAGPLRFRNEGRQDSHLCSW